MKQDGWKLKFVEWGSFALDGGAMFGVVPRPLWSKLAAPDEANRIPMALRSLYLERGDMKVLVDLGMGYQWEEKQKKIYKLEASPTEQLLQDRLGLAPASITHVVLTHLHFDHCGALSTRHGAEWRSTFPNAEIFLCAENFRTATAPNPREAASYLPHLWAYPFARGQFTLYDCEWLELRELLPGIRVRRVDGHTRGQTIVYVDGEQTDYIFLADLCPTEHHLKATWVMGYDLHAALSVQEKLRIFNEPQTLERELVLEHSTTAESKRLVRAPSGQLEWKA